MSTSSPREELLTKLLKETGMKLNSALILHELAVAGIFDLSVSDWLSSEMVLTHGPLTAGDLARKTGLSTGAVTGVLDRLEKAGVVRRVSDSQDRRKVLVEIRPGLYERLGANPYNHLREGVLKIVEDYSDSDLERIITFVAKTTALFESSAQALWERKKGPRPLYSEGTGE